MNKPITMIYEEFKQMMASIINNSGLPPFVIKSILQNYLYEIDNLAKEQYQLDKKQYEESLSKSLSEENKK